MLECSALKSSFSAPRPASHLPFHSPLLFPLASTMSSRTILDVPTILDPSCSGGKKRRRDGDTEAPEEKADARGMARLISTVLSGPHPAPVDEAEGGADVGGGSEKEASEGKSIESDRKAELRAQIAAARAENEAIDARRRDVFGAYANLSSIYNYGLSHIAKLNDLSGAPDNTLPGNHPKVSPK